MAKKVKTDPVEKARKRLVKAQADLRGAQDDRARVKLEGEQTIERARQQAAHDLSRATLRVEERAAALDQAQRRLDEVRGGTTRAPQPPADKDLRVVVPGDSVGSGSPE